MSSEKVWLRFETKKKDGTLMKLRIQDLPKTRVDDAVELMFKFFAREEALHRCVGILDTPQGSEGYLAYLKATMNDPKTLISICCSDDTTEVKEIFGVSVTTITKDNSTWYETGAFVEEHGTPAAKKLFAIFMECLSTCEPLSKFDLDQLYDDKGVLVVPDYRGLGIAEKILHARRLQAKSYGIPMTAAWMTAFGTQIAAERDNWETICEVKYSYLSKKYDVIFTDVPPTMKYMIARSGKTETTSTRKLIQQFENINFGV